MRISTPRQVPWRRGYRLATARDCARLLLHGGSLLGGLHLGFVTGRSARPVKSRRFKFQQLLGHPPEQIQIEYDQRAREIPSQMYSIAKPVNLFWYQDRCRRALDGLRRFRLLPLENRSVLEVGCGAGGWLADFERWGVKRGSLAGIDLNPDRIREAQLRLGRTLGFGDGDSPVQPDIRVGDASKLPWRPASFDVVLQSTVFTSILDVRMREAVAR